MSVPLKLWLHQWHFQFVPQDVCSWQPSCRRLVAVAPDVLFLDVSAPFLLGCGWVGAAVGLLLCPLWARLSVFFKAVEPPVSSRGPVSLCCFLLWLPPAMSL